MKTEIDVTDLQILIEIAKKKVVQVGPKLTAVITDTLKRAESAVAATRLKSGPPKKTAGI